MSKIETYLSSHQKPFPKPNSKINTEDFLNACKDFVTMLDLFGSIFQPASYDLNCNIQKIMQVYEKNCDRNKYLEDMILREKEDGNLLAIDALMWLRRSLKFLLEFFDGLSNESKEETNLLIKKAYSKSLKMYHGWFVGNLFNILARMVPPRSVLIKQLGLGKENCEEVVLNDIKEFTINLRWCVNHLTTFYQDNGLETH
ncbi:hypothetical protein FQR65_LT09839 [Abscondita terminalis]|nr:hypothetical protein FQR65_LT09839 [Abscondita terminalis]